MAISRRCVRTLALSFLILLLSVSGTAAVSSPNGAITSLAPASQETPISQEASINVQVHNPSSEKKTYKLTVLLSHDGTIVHSQPLTFSVPAGRKLSFKPSFVPSNIGEYTVIATLKDKHETTTYARRSTSFRAVSDIGPFDLAISPLSRNARPESEIPLLVTFKNLGQEGTDVKIRAVINCIDHRNIKKEFFVFANASQTQQRATIDLPSCPGTGMRQIDAQLLRRGQRWITASSQVFLSNNLQPMTIQFPTELQAERGETATFDAIVENRGNKTLHNLQVSLQQIPVQWYSVTPPQINRLGPEESGLFLINLSIPADAEQGPYPLKIAAGSDETLATGRSSLQLVSETPVNTDQYIIGGKDTRAISRTSLLVSGVVLVLVASTGGFVVWKRKQQDKQEKKEKLDRIKKAVGV
jgi:hypothetical protein